MGLICSHGFWNGPYTMFHRWRCELARVAGYGVAPWDFGDGVIADAPVLPYEQLTIEQHEGQWERTPDDPLLVLLAHSDCSGEIAPEQAAPLAARLEELLPQVRQIPMADAEEAYDGVPKIDWHPEWTQRAIDALRTAAARGESVRFF
jgi:hypothetical protein